MKTDKAIFMPVPLTMENLRRLRQIEQVAYAQTPFVEMRDHTSWDSIADYCECELSELRVFMADRCYALLAEHEDYVEFVDLASETRHTPLFQVLAIVEQFDKPFIMECREHTSYRMIQSLAKAERIRLEKDEAYSRGGETFHEIELQPVLCQRCISELRLP